MSVKPCQEEWSAPEVMAEAQSGICHLCQGGSGLPVSHLLKGNSPHVAKKGAWEAIRCERHFFRLIIYGYYCTVFHSYTLPV